MTLSAVVVDSGNHVEDQLAACRLSETVEEDFRLFWQLVTVVRLAENSSLDLWVCLA